MITYAPANLLFILDSRRNMRRTMELIGEFDSDTFANQRVTSVRSEERAALRPGEGPRQHSQIDLARCQDRTVQFLPVDRINTLIAVAPNPGVFDTIEEWMRSWMFP